MKTSLTAIFAALAAPAAAQDILLPPIVISANLDETEADRTGATVDVLTADDLQKGETRLLDQLDRIPGISISTRGPLGTVSGFAIRGASQNYVKVLVDGIDVTDPSSPQVAFDFGRAVTAGIGRVEVLKGSHSALYGSRAIGGVISIFSDRATRPGTHHRIAAEVGSFDTRQLTYGVTHKSDRADLAVTLGHLASDTYSAADEADGNDESEGFESNRLSFNGSYLLDGGVRVGASGFIERTSSGYDTSYPVVTDGPEWNDTDSAAVRAFAQFSTGTFDNEVSISRFEVDRWYREPFATYGYTGTRDVLDWRATTALAGGRLTFGADWTREAFDQAGDYGTLSTENEIAGVYGELGWELGERADLTVSLRHDDNSRFGGATSGRAALAYRVAEDLILRGQAGTGFRAPSNYELYAPFGGNPDLDPEESRNVDLGIEKRFGTTASLRATAFYLEVDNLISYTTGYQQVDGTSRRSGLELSGDLEVGSTTLSAGYTYTDSSANTSTSWAEVPRHMLTLGLGADITPQLSGLVTLRAASDRPTTGDYTVVNAAASYDLGRGTEVYLRVENILDEEYQLVQDYGTSDRAAYVGIRKAW